MRPRRQRRALGPWTALLALLVLAPAAASEDGGAAAAAEDGGGPAAPSADEGEGGAGDDAPSPAEARGPASAEAAAQEIAPSEGGDGEAGEPGASLAVAPPGPEREGALEIGGVVVHPGEKREIRLRTSESFAATDVDIPLVVIRGSRPGPTLCLVAGVHGDELNGIEIVREILETHRPADLSGTLVGIPIVNLFGFSNQSRYLPDRRDLNRHFPGRPTGSTASRIAYRLWNGVLRHCTHLIDFHTGSLHRSNLPQVRGDLSRPEVLDLASAFGARVVIHNPGQRGTLRSYAVDQGIPAILYEAGETMRFQKGEIRKGVLGTRNVMVHLGMRRGRRVDLGSETVFLETHWIRAQQGGILDLYPSLGEWISKGDIIGVITDPLRKEKGLVVSPYRGRVVGKVLAPMVIPGLAIVHVGVPGGRMGASDADQEELDGERPE